MYTNEVDDQNYETINHHGHTNQTSKSNVVYELDIKSMEVVRETVCAMQATKILITISQRVRLTLRNACGQHRVPSERLWTGPVMEYIKHLQLRNHWYSTIGRKLFLKSHIYSDTRQKPKTSENGHHTKPTAFKKSKK